MMKFHTERPNFYEHCYLHFPSILVLKFVERKKVLMMIIVNFFLDRGCFKHIIFWAGGLIGYKHWSTR